MQTETTEVARVHVASSPIDGRQHCRLCGITLIEAGPCDGPVIVFSAGAMVVKAGEHLTAVQGDALPAGMAVCVQTERLRTRG